MNRSEIFNSEKNKLRQKRLNAQIKAKNTQQELLKNADFQQLELESRKLMIEITKHEPDSDIAKTLKQQYNKIEKQKQELLKKMDLSADDLQPHYTCPLCNDTGFVGANVMCDCLKKNIQQRLKHESGLGDFCGHSFADCDQNLLKQNKTLNKAFKIAHSFVQNFPNNQYKNLVFVGNVGKGKTFLSECIANELIAKDFYVVYLTSFELNNIVIKTMDLFADNRQDLLSPLLECDLLIIDDLGTEPIYKNMSVNNLYTIINQRQLQNLSTIISTNLTPQMIRDQYGDRLFSRIFNKHNTMPILFDGEDLRIKAKN